MKKILIFFTVILFTGLGVAQVYAQISFIEGKPLTDIDGNIYATLIIGSKTWMAENLAVTRLNDGRHILLANKNAIWSDADSPAYCWYKNDQEQYGKSYGVLYNWYAVNTGKLCPPGWQVPSDQDWQELFDKFGGRHRAGEKLKERGTSHWISPNAGTDSVRVEKTIGDPNFRALPGGYRLTNGTFVGIGSHGYWWTSTPGNDKSSWCHKMFYNKGDTYRYSVSNKYGASVRCIKNQ